MLEDIVVIPEPKKVKLNRGRFILSKKNVIFLDKERYGKIGRALQKELKKASGFNIPIIHTDLPFASLFISNKDSVKREMQLPKKLGAEGYFLKTDKKDIVIIGGSEAGLFYGIQTLLQLLEDGLRLRCMEITDWTDLKIRGIHLDLKGAMPTFEYLKKTIRKLAKYKINTILIEYEDKFKYEKHALISSPVALTKEQAKELIDIAKEHYIEMIPLIQCLGHVEYILKHKKYNYLSECPHKTIQQYCPLNPGTLKLYKELCSEVLVLHKDTRYLHIGGDEPYWLGRCRKCAEKAEKNGRLEIYIDYIKEVCQFIKDKGGTPIIWGDVLSRQARPKLLKELPRDLIIIDWDYKARTDERPMLYWKPGVRISRQWLRKNYGKDWIPSDYIYQKENSGFIEDIPAQTLKSYKKYLDSEHFPKMVNSLPYIRFFQDRGFKVIGASTLGRCENSCLFPDYTIRIPNVMQWAKTMVRNNGLGVISTSWAKTETMAPPGAPLEMMWYGMIASAEYYWSAEKMSEEEFDRKFNYRFYGVKSQEITDSMFLINKELSEYALEKLNAVSPKVKRNRLNIEYLKVAALMACYQKQKEKIFQGKAGIGSFEARYHRIVAGNLTPVEKMIIRNELTNQLKKLKKSLDELKHKESKIFQKTMPSSEVKEMINSHFLMDAKKITDYLKFILKEKFF